MKPPVYRHAVLVAFSLGLLVLPMGCYQLSVSFEPSELDTSSSATQTSQSQSTVSSVSTLPGSALVPSTAVENKTQDAKKTVTAYRPNSSSKASPLGNLRLSNQTNQPVRLALLSRRSLAKGSSGHQDAVPAHWDFAPNEGSDKGLVLSLASGNLELQKGDILVAFAQDGSRRYWGPYIVGETSSPNWNSQGKEWQLILSP